MCSVEQYIVAKLEFVPFDKLGLLLCYIESVVPSAQMGIVVLQQKQCSEVASQPRSMSLYNTSSQHLL